MPTVLITGANRGLGLEFTRQYAADGWAVIACCRNPAKAEALQALAAKNKSINIEALDVTDQKSIGALAEKLKNTPVDVLINNAGIYSGADGPLTPESKMDGQNFGAIDGVAWENVLKTNVITPIMVTQTFMPHLMQGKERKVVMITSMMGSIELMKQGSVAYRSSKAALNAATRSITHDLTAQKIAVVNIHPGWVQTDMGGNGADITPEVSITGIRKIIAELSIKNTGQFIDYTGKVIPW